MLICTPLALLPNLPIPSRPCRKAIWRRYIKNLLGLPPPVKNTKPSSSSGRRILLLHIWDWNVIRSSRIMICTTNERSQILKGEAMNHFSCKKPQPTRSCIICCAPSLASAMLACVLFPLGLPLWGRACIWFRLCQARLSRLHRLYSHNVVCAVCLCTHNNGPDVRLPKKIWDWWSKIVAWFPCMVMDTKSMEETDAETSHNTSAEHLTKEMRTWT